MTMDRDNDAQQQHTGSERPRTGVILAFLIGGGVIIGLSIFSQYARTRPPVAVPGLRILHHDTARAGDTTYVRFVTPAHLMLHNNAWMAGELHPHLQLGNETRMAGSRDIVHVAADTFAWKITSLRPGTHDIALFWADMAHVTAGDSSRMQLIIIP
jgi:hypothetical protein